MGKRGRPKKKAWGFPLKKNTLLSILAVVFLGLSLLAAVSFSRRVPALAVVNQKLIDFFGWPALFSPFVLLSFALALSGLKSYWARINVLVGAIIFFISLLGLSRAGLVGYFLKGQLVGYIGQAGAVLVYLSGAFIGIIVLFDTSIASIVSGTNKFLTVIGGYFVNNKREKSLSGRSYSPREDFSDDKDKKAIRVIDRTQRKTSPQNTRPPEPKKIEEETALPTVPGARGDVWRYPPLGILSDKPGGKADRGNVNKNANTIEETLDSFGISARVVEVNRGPAVTQYAIQVALGTKLSKITNLSNDLALALAAPTGQIRIEAPIPGRSLAGIELPNRSPEVVTLKEIILSDEMRQEKSKLAVPLGLGVSGQAVIGRLDKMPHVLIAGQTGSGKSVLLNSWIASFLFRTTPEEVKLILVDPKRVELSVYEGIPHLKSSVIVEPKNVISALEWAVGEMEDRYKKFAKAGARNIDSYNQKSGFAAMPYLVIIIDELADIMLFAPSDVEERICRLAQMARATGIHLVVATQRPSVDVLTGLIKANIPCRISCAVTSSVDSRVILDSPGAEKLLGRGDMLYLPPDQAKPHRIQGAFVSEEEIKKMVDFLKNTGVEPVYTEEVLETPVKTDSRGRIQVGEDRDDLLDEALEVIFDDNRASSSLLMRRLQIGYSRSARILDDLEAAGIIGPPEGSKPREILVNNFEEAKRMISPLSS
ncbi:MAG: DNA translocase FtsK [Candidatus Shapirobacteria bacterium]|nr:DNA translocase FtsK [Candidatus Shapirobacteria bacterium]MDD5073688.1 DNA translocase FtsK [Candidatus Shapirobacteria bacterium]MDD5481450.1 DNA translocase FtsK [Candidatus Shapirobacteria bacterium]